MKKNKKKAEKKGSKIKVAKEEPVMFSQKSNEASVTSASVTSPDGIFPIPEPLEQHYRLTTTGVYVHVAQTRIPKR